MTTEHDGRDIPKASCAGLTRASVSLRRTRFEMDCCVKPGKGGPENYVNLA